MLEIKNLTKKFGSKTAVDGVSFFVKSGEIFSLVGPNGSGKTTIIKNIAGLLRPGGGNIAVDGHDVVLDPLGAKSAIGYIPDEPSAWSGMTGEEFLHFAGALYGMGPEKRVQKLPELLKIFRLDGAEKEYFESYSRGNRQKFAILSALLHSPKLLLIDEPIVGLDPESATAAKREFIRFAKAGGAILMVTHTLPVAGEISSRVGVLSKGRLIAMGTMEELRARARKGLGSGLEDIYTALIPA